MSLDLKRDSVNRKFNLVKVPVHAGPNVHVGDVVDLVGVDEQEITPDIKDPMEGFGQPDGSNYGDAIFDSMTNVAEPSTILGVARSPSIMALGFSLGNESIFLGVDGAAGVTVFDPMAPRS